jgi:hypothetical protein
MKCTKLNIVRSFGESLILVPCWWDGRIERQISFPYSISPPSYIHTISHSLALKHTRPDLLPSYNHFDNANNALPISLNPLEGYFERM